MGARLSSIALPTVYRLPSTVHRHYSSLQRRYLPVEPAGGLFERGEVVRLALPDADGRDDEEDEGREAEEHAAEARARDGAHDLKEDRAGDDGELEREPLRGVKARPRLGARRDRQLDDGRDEPDVKREVGQDVGDVLGDRK